MSTTNDRIQDAVDDADDTGYIIGTVIDNVDPDGLGRIKCRVPNLFDDSQGPVPWVGPHKKSPFGIGSGYGVYGSPAIGSQVRIKLQDNDAHYAIFEADEYSKANANTKFKDPTTWGFKDPSGSELFVNMTTGDWQFTHKSGITIFFNTTGDRTTNLPGNDVLTVTKNSTQNIDGNLTINVTGTANITATGACNVKGSPINLN